MAAPSTSARSHATMAISHRIQSATFTPRRIGFTARLREVPAGNDPKPRRPESAAGRPLRST